MTDKTRRVVVYVPEEDYRQLKGKLRLMGLTMSGWMRRLIRQFNKRK